MSASRWIAVAMGAVILVSTIADAVTITIVETNERFLGTMISSILAVPYLAMGPYLAFRQPRNAIGWLVGASSALLLVQGIARHSALLFGPQDAAAMVPQSNGVSLLLFVYAIFLF